MTKEKMKELKDDDLQKATGGLDDGIEEELVDEIEDDVEIPLIEGVENVGEIPLGTNVRENESLESSLRRFKRNTSRNGIIAEGRKREHYEKPSVKRKKKAEAARKRKW